MKMIWHHDESIQFDVWAQMTYLLPAFFNSHSQVIDEHIAFTNLAKEASLPVSADRYEVRSALAVVISWQADCPARGFG